MYIPEHFRMEDAEVEAALIQGGLFLVVTTEPDGPEATPLPLVYDPQAGTKGALLGHFARANDHWRRAAGPGALALLQGEGFYVTPSWYASKAAHGKVVPTWNYQLIEIRGNLETFDDPEEKRAMLDRLTDLHEARRAAPWAVGDAPARFIETQLRGIVGMRLEITSVQGKRKMSQNRDEADRAGVFAGRAAETGGEGETGGEAR